MQTKTTIKCLCGREVTLEIVGGQYQDEYYGECECGKKWRLQDLSEVLAEISDIFPENNPKKKIEKYK